MKAIAWKQATVPKKKKKKKKRTSKKMTAGVYAMLQSKNGKMCVSWDICFLFDNLLAGYWNIYNQITVTPVRRINSMLSKSTNMN